MKRNVIKVAALVAVSVILTTAFILDVQNCFGAPPSPPPPPRHSPSPPPSNGGRVTRVITSKTGKVIRVEPHGTPSPGHHADPRPPKPFPPGILPPGPPPRPRPGLLPPPPPIIYWPVSSTTYNSTVNYNSTYNSSPYETTEYPTIQLLGLYEVYDNHEKSCGWLLMYYEPKNKTLGGYFNPTGAKIVKKEWIKDVHGTVLTIDDVETSWFRIDDEFGTTCFIPFKEMLYESIMSGTLRQASSKSDTPETTIFFLKRIK